MFSLSPHLGRGSYGDVGAVLFRRPLLWRLAVLGDGQTSRGRGATVDVMKDMIYKLIVT